MSLVRVYSGSLPINSLDDIYELFTKLGFTINSIEGTIIFTTKKSFIKRSEVRYNIKIYIVGNNIFVFGILKDEGSLEAIAKLYSKNNEWYFECINKEYDHLCSSILDTIRKGIKLYKTQMIKSSSDTSQRIFRMSRVFETFLDGFAEVTAISAAIKYPMVERRTVKLSEVGDVFKIIEYLYSRYRSGRYVILILGRDWMFSIAVDLDSKEYTPSLVVWSNNLRLLGEKALEAFNQIDRNEDVRFTIYLMQD